MTKIDKNDVFFEGIIEEYKKTKEDFQSKNLNQLAKEISHEIKGHESTFNEVFGFLVESFKGQLRRDNKTPLVFHSIFITKILYLCDEKELDSLLVASLHDILEDTEVSEEELKNKQFMKDKGYLIDYLKTLKENTGLSREPDGQNLPPRYKEHIKRIIGAPREVVNLEVIDRFCDLMDLEYITKLPKEERDMRLKAKIIKVRSFVENITKNRQDYNKTCLELFEYQLNKVENEWGINKSGEIIS